MTLTDLPPVAAVLNPATVRQREPRSASTSMIVGDVLRSEWTRLRTVRSTYWTAFFVGQAILSGKNLGVSVAAPGAVRSIIGTGLYLGVLGLLSLGLGTLLRKTAGAIAALFAILLIVPVIVSLLPSSINGIQKYLPSNAGQELVFGSGQSTGDVLSPWVGFGVFCLYAFVTLAIAAAVLVRRDA